jgi:hypothetical protein
VSKPIREEKVLKNERKYEKAHRTRGSVLGSGTMLRAGRQRFRLPARLLDLFPLT